jgi:glycosyltransferase involved in cell wall biosynthesis
MSNNKPIISVILPTYNRANFLPQAFASLKQQIYSDWELIIVDDGSTDNSLTLLKKLIPTLTQHCQIIEQKNQGPAAARNTGIKLARGIFTAFFDSDDVWFPNHLALAMEVFNTNPHFDWLYFACERRQYGTDEILLESTFYTDNIANNLFDCAVPVSENLYQLDNDKGALCQLVEGIDNGLQNSVIKTELIQAIPIPDFRVGEDRLLILQALKQGVTMAFYDAVTVTYYVHESNTSDTNPQSRDFKKRIEALKRLLVSYEATPLLVDLNPVENQAFTRRLAKDYVWKLGFSLELENRAYLRALAAIYKGIKLNPKELSFYKVYLTTLVKMFLYRGVFRLLPRK